MPTDVNMASITLNALSKFSSSAMLRLAFSLALSTDIMNAAPSSSKTSDTVVEVGIFSVLNRSSTITSVIITATNTIITSLNVK